MTLPVRLAIYLAASALGWLLLAALVWLGVEAVKW